MTGTPDGASSADPPRGNGLPTSPNNTSHQDTEETEQPANPLEQQYTASSFTGTALSVIVVAVLGFFQPTISSSSWTPWFRAVLAIAVLTSAVIAVALVVKLA